MFRGHSAEDTRSDEEDENDLDADARGDDDDEREKEGQEGGASTTARAVTINEGGVRHRTGGAVASDDERIGRGGGGGMNGHAKADS